MFIRPKVPLNFYINQSDNLYLEKLQFWFHNTKKFTCFKIHLIKLFQNWKLGVLAVVKSKREDIVLSRRMST